MHVSQKVPREPDLQIRFINKEAKHVQLSDALQSQEFQAPNETLAYLKQQHMDISKKVLSFQNKLKQFSLLGISP